jgi:ABC-type Fe3+/spermidine/putrescine transport system ATPase subunit
LESVLKRFGDVVAVSGVSLDVTRGSLTTILGPSGCGKTTILRLIAGFLEPDAGNILIDGASQRGLPPYLRKTSTVFQEYALFPHMSVLNNVAYGLRLRRLPRAAIAEKVRHTLSLLQLGGLEERVALARSLIVEPDVLLMDEPLSNLDAKLRVSVRTEIREIQQRVGITTLYVTHDQDEALAISDTIAVMQGGTVMQVGSPRDIYERPADPFVAAFVGQVNLLRTRAEAGVLILGTLRLPIPPGAPPLEPGQEAILALRPEAIRIGAGADAPDGLTGEVVSKTYLGTTVRYRIALADQTLTVDDHDPAGKPLLEGLVLVSFDPSRIRLWPASAEMLQLLQERI